MILYQSGETRIWIWINVLGAFHHTVDCNYEHSAQFNEPRDRITVSLKEVKEVPNMLNRLRESQMLSSIFPKYAIVMFVIDLGKSFLFMQGYQNCWKFYTTYTMVYKKCWIEVNGEKWYVEKNHFDFLCLDFVYKMKFVWVCYLEEKEQLKKCSLLDNNHTDFKNWQKFNFFEICIETTKLYEIFTINAIL